MAPHGLVEQDHTGAWACLSASVLWTSDWWRLRAPLAFGCVCVCARVIARALVVPVCGQTVEPSGLIATLHLACARDR